MWRLWNKLFGWQYAKVRHSGKNYIVRMKPFGDETYDGEYGYRYIINWDPEKYSVKVTAGYEKSVPLTDKLYDKSPKATVSGNVITLNARK